MATVPEFLECPLCFEVFTQVVESPCCHRCFCLKCIKDWLSKNLTCPNCRNPLASADSCVPNIPFQRLVDELPATCVNSTLGCTDKITRGILKDHLKNCGYMILECQYGTNNCKEILRKDYEKHKETCIFRPVPCTQCTITISFNQLEKHMDLECPNTLLKCSHSKCTAHIKRVDLTNHLEKECPFSLIYCPFSKFGICNEKILRGKLDKHFKQKPLEHIKIALEENIRLQTENEELKKSNVDFELGIRQLTELKPKLLFNPLHTVDIPVILPSFLVMDESFRKIAFITGENYNYAGILKSKGSGSLFSWSSSSERPDINVIITGDRPVPSIARYTNLPYYFEITIKAKEDPGVLFGFIDDSNGNNKGILGKIPQSYALEVHNHRLYGPSVSSKSYGGTRSFAGTFGCGWDQKDQVIFFIVDETCGGSAFRNVSGNLKPAICLTSAAAEVFVNFGVSKFVWDPKKYWDPYRSIERDMHKCLDSGTCTFKVTGMEYFPQLMYHCKDCNLETNFGVCEVCVKRCHSGHAVSHAIASLGFFCDCGHLTHTKEKNLCKSLPADLKMTYN